MIEKLFNNPQVLYQTADDDCSVPEQAISIYTDSSGLIILGQEGRNIIINKASVKELVKVLKDLTP